MGIPSAQEYDGALGALLIVLVWAGALVGLYWLIVRGQEKDFLLWAWGAMALGSLVPLLKLL